MKLKDSYSPTRNIYTLAYRAIREGENPYKGICPTIPNLDGIIKAADRSYAAIQPIPGAEDNNVRHCARCKLVVSANERGLCAFCQRVLLDSNIKKCARCDSTIEVSPLSGLCWSCEQALREDDDGEGAEPDFPPETNDVTSQYIDGTLQITLSRDLDKRQVRAFCYGATQRRGVKSCELDSGAAFASGYTAFSVCFNPKYARLIEEVRAELTGAARDFLAEIVDAPTQAALFEAVPTQSSMF